LKVFRCFFDFQKEFDSIPREAMFQRFGDIGISKIPLTTIMCLYESVLGHLCTAHGLTDFIKSTIRLKQGCPLSPTLFKIYIDEMESFLRKHTQPNNGYLLHHALISILLFVDNVLLLASTPKDFSRQLDTLSNFCDLQ